MGGGGGSGHGVPRKGGLGGVPQKDGSLSSNEVPGNGEHRVCILGNGEHGYAYWTMVPDNAAGVTYEREAGFEYLGEVGSWVGVGVGRVKRREGEELHMEGVPEVRGGRVVEEPMKGVASTRTPSGPSVSNVCCISVSLTGNVV